ncbi:MAG: hypothetical protein K6G08_03825 [Prevotella sp.]|nr:hypothetical protein [Prevotella sp.]
MKKKLLMMLVAMVGMTLQGIARTTQTSGTPEVKKIVVVNADKVNIRKQPTVNSPRISSAEHGACLVITGESGDWYATVINEEPDDYREGMPKVINGYIMKKFCDDAELVPITTVMLNDDENIRYDMVSSGKHKDVAIVQNNTGFMSEVWIGKNKDNMWCFDRMAMQGELVNDFKLNTESGMFDFSHLTDAQVDSILRKTNPWYAKVLYWVKGRPFAIEEYYYRKN